MVEIVDEELNTSGQLDQDPRYTVRDNNGNVLYDNVKIELRTPVRVDGTDWNKGLYGRIYNLDIDPIGKINIHSTIKDREGFLLCDGSLVSTLDYPDTAGIANRYLAVDTNRTFGYEYAGCDYSTSTEKLYFYKVTGTLIEVFETVDMQTFTKITDYTLRYGYSPKAEYKNGAIIITERSSSSGGSYYFAVTINNTNFATFTVSPYSGTPVYDYYNKNLVLCYERNSTGNSNVYIYTISNDSTTATSRILNQTTYSSKVDGVTYDKNNNAWLVGGRSRASGYPSTIYLSTDDADTFSVQTASSQTVMNLAYNEYTQKSYVYTTTAVYEIDDVTAVFDNLVEVYTNSAFSSSAKYNYRAKYPSAFQNSSSESVIVTNFAKVYYLSNIQVKSIFSLGDYTYIIATNNELYEINVVNKQGLLLPQLIDTTNRYYGYIKVEVL